MKCGISLYLGDGMNKNIAQVEEAAASGARFAFTSMHIPEERIDDYRGETLALLGACREAGLELIADVSPATLARLGCSSLDELAALGIGYVRLDYGFDARETVELSRTFHVVFNASTISMDDVHAWMALGADLTRFAACHNFYPKPLTGLSIERVRRVNERLRMLGLATFAFVPGDARLRGPLGEGLPTVEDHRGDSGDELVRDILELVDADTDVVLFGDPGVSSAVWSRMADLTEGEGFVRLRAQVDPSYAYVREQVHHDRVDSSEFVIRSQESRGYASLPRASFHAEAYDARPCGSISVGNDGFARYSGELEIARRDLAHEPRVNVVGQVAEEDLPWLPFIKDGRGFLLVE